MDIQYRIKKDKVEIVRCFGADAQVEIPAKIAGREVAYAAPYAFSARKRKEDTDVFIWRSKDETVIPREKEKTDGADMQSVPAVSDGADTRNVPEASDGTDARKVMNASDASDMTKSSGITAESPKAVVANAAAGAPGVRRTDLPEESEELLAGERIESVVFPETMREIGNYIFYGCKNLRSLEFSDSLMNIGSGAFTGCSALSKLTVHMCGGEKTCVKEILGDLWQRIDVYLVREGADGRTGEYGRPAALNRSSKYVCAAAAGSLDETGERGGIECRERSASKEAACRTGRTGRESAAGSDAVLVFPEHFEEAVENTPARILFTQHHGSGNNYRQCFYNKEVDYEKYDSLFSVAMVYDRVDVLTDLAFGRLLHPVRLAKAHRETYSAYLRENAKEVGEYLVRAQKQEELDEMGRQGFWTREALDAVIQYAAAEENRAAVSTLMDVRQRLFPAQRRRRYEL